MEIPVVHMNPTFGKTDAPHKKKLRTHLGIVAQDKMDVTFVNKKEVPASHKDLTW